MMHIGPQDILYKYTKELHANVTKEHIHVYLDVCDTCNLEESKVRKSLVVKPIISRVTMLTPVLKSDGIYHASSGMWEQPKTLVLISTTINFLIRKDQTYIGL